MTEKKLSLNQLSSIFPKIKKIDEQIGKQIEIDYVYEIYLKRQRADIKKCKLEENTKIPKNLDFRSISGLSNESIEILTKSRPATLSQASRLPGFTPSAVTLLLSYLKKNDIKRA